MALPLLPIAGALLGGLTGYMGAPDDNKLGGTITGGLLGGLTGGIGKLAGIGNIGKASTLSNAASTTGRMANSSWNPVSLLKSAYTPDAGGLFNLGMDALPLITDIANNDVGAKSFTGFAGTMAGTRFGGRELNQAGEKQLKSDVLNRAQQYSRTQEKYNARPSVLSGKSKPMKDIGDYDIQPFEMAQTKKYQNDPTTSKQGYNMAVGMGADMGLYSLTAGLNKPKEPTEVVQGRQQREFSESPVGRYIQMTGAL